MDAAAKQILDLMEPGDDAVREERKRAQLRELALLNGTVRVRVPCARTSHRTAAGYHILRKRLPRFRVYNISSLLSTDRCQDQATKI